MLSPAFALHQLIMSRVGSAESRALGIADAKLLGVSASGQLAFLHGTYRSLKFFSPSGGTLASVSLAGGGPRDVLDQVLAADWIPGTDKLVVARTDGQVEFPIGTKFYKSPFGGIRAVRVAPDGARVALIQPGPAGVEVLVLDRSSRMAAHSSVCGWNPRSRSA